MELNESTGRRPASADRDRVRGARIVFAAWLARKREDPHQDVAMTIDDCGCGRHE
ncbi:hypothetical protein LC55x_2454 [Lysobacter capsici]|nr:hypothetical protein LC55x_2454 [Lysobacter capsici]